MYPAVSFGVLHANQSSGCHCHPEMMPSQMSKLLATLDP